jgi:hypothetical protein
MTEVFAATRAARVRAWLRAIRASHRAACRERARTRRWKRARPVTPLEVRVYSFTLAGATFVCGLLLLGVSR